MNAFLDVKDVMAAEERERNARLKVWDSFKSLADLVAWFENDENRLAYAVSRLRSCLNMADGKIADRVGNAASRLVCGTNRQSDWLRRRARNIQFSRFENQIIKVEPLRLDQIGHLYFAQSPLRPSTLKIGFTTRYPELRVRNLMAASGEEINLIGSFVGTYLDEQVFQFANEEDRVKSEWYFKPRALPAVNFLHDYANKTHVIRSNQEMRHSEVPTQ